MWTMGTTPKQHGSGGVGGRDPKPPKGLLDVVVVMSREATIAALGAITWKAAMIRASISLIFTIVKWVGAKLLARGEITEVYLPDPERQYSLTELDEIRKWFILVRRDDQAIETTGTIASITEGSQDALPEGSSEGNSEEESPEDEEP